MSKNTQHISRFFEDFEGDMRQVPTIIAETAREYYLDRFKYKNWDGKPWPKYNPNDNPNRKEPTRGSLMMRSNMLMQSVRPEIVRSDLVRMSAGSSKVPYARIHNEGGRVRSVQYVRPFHNKNFMGRGKRQQIRPHTRKQDFFMPKRQFMGHSTALNNRITTRLANQFKKP
ncbi:MAG: phage virion morphogenesis protein [Cyclobacteriaceae bacterium]